MALRLLLVIGVLVCGINAASQNVDMGKIRDSLKNELLSSQHDTATIATYIMLSRAYADRDSSEKYKRLALTMAEEKLEVSRVNEKPIYKSYLSDALLELGVFKAESGANKEAELLYKRCIKLRRELNDQKGLAYALLNLAFNYSNLGEMQEAENTYLSTIDAYRRSGDEEGLSLALTHMGFMYRELGNTKEATDCLKQAKDIRERIESKDLAVAYNSLAIIYLDQMYYVKVLDLGYKALELSEESGNKLHVSQSLNIIASVHYKQENWEKCLEYSQRILQINEEIGNHYLRGTLLANIAALHKKMDNHRLAIEFFKEAYLLNKGIGDLGSALGDMANLGSTYLDLDSIKMASIYLDSAEVLCRKIGLANVLDFILLLKGKLALRTNDLFKAEKYGLESLRIAQENKKASDMRDANHLLFETYKEKANWQKALFHYQNYVAKRDSIANLEVEKAALEKEKQYEVEKLEQEAALKLIQSEQKTKLKEADIKVLKKEKALQESILYSLIIGGILLIAAGLFWFRSYSLKKKKEELDARRQVEIYMKEIDVLQAAINSKLSVNEPMNVDVINLNLNQFLSAPLSNREMEVLIELSKGYGNQEIADNLYVSINTVRTHLKSIYEKLKVKNRTQAVKKAGKLKLIKF